MTEDLVKDLTLAQAASLIHDRTLTPLALVEASLERIAQLDPVLNAFLTIMDDHARRRADEATRALARGEDWGPLHGIPIGVKDVIDVAGVRMTAGSEFLRDHVAHEDAPVVIGLRAAGAIVIGKTHLHEYAIGATNVNPHFGPARNPWDTDRITGGSSGGSGAAVAAGLCLGALGTDTGGSVRIPAGLCNLTGLRPAKNQISTQGVIPMSWTVDTVGPMAHTAHDIALMLDALERRPGSYVDSLDHRVDALRVGVPADDYFWDETVDEVSERVRAALDALADLGVKSADVSLPMVDDVRAAAGVILISEAAAYHRERLQSQPDRFGADLQERLLEALEQYSAVDYALARQTAREWRGVLHEAFRAGIDILALPTTPVPAPKLDGIDNVSVTRQLIRFNHPLTLSAMPCLSVPCGFTAEGLPVGIQLVAPQTETLLRAAHAYQQITDWHTRRPSIGQ